MKGNETKKLPDGGWGWVIVGGNFFFISLILFSYIEHNINFYFLASFLTNIVASGIPYSFGILLQPLVVAFKSSAGVISFVGSVNLAMMYLPAPLTSSLINKFGTRYS